MLSVRRGAKAVEFYKKAFGARELFCVANDAGEVVAQLAVGEAEFWVADESPENKNFSPESLGAEFRGGATVRMVMVVDDPDALFKRALEAGANEVWTRRRPALWMARRTPGRSLRPSLGNWQAARVTPASATAFARDGRRTTRNLCGAGALAGPVLCQRMP